MIRISGRIAVDAANASLNVGIPGAGVDQVDRLVDSDLEPGFVADPLNAHRLDGDSEAQGERGGTRRGMGRPPEKRRGDSAVEFLVVHQSHGLASSQTAHQLPRALEPFRSEQPNAVPETVFADHRVHVWVVHGPIGDLAIHARLDDRRRHQLEVRKVAGYEYNRSAARGDRGQTLGAFNFDPARIGDDSIERRVLRRRPPQFIPLRAEQLGDLGVVRQREHDPQVSLCDPVGRRQRSKPPKQPGAEI